jgi:polyisoprenoid-binding protein YceI
MISAMPKQEQMKKIPMLIGLAILATTLSNAQTLNSEQSVVNFSIKNMKIRTVKGTFTGMKGEVHFDESDLAGSGFKVSVDAASVNTGNKKRDEHLRDEDFFHVEAYPIVSFESTSIQKTNSGFITRGNLNMHGVSKEVEIPFTYSKNQFKGRLELNRFHYKIGEETGTTAAGESVRLEIVAILN